MSHARTLPTNCPVLLYGAYLFIYSHCKFYSCPNIFWWAYPSRITFPLNNPLSYPHRNRGISLRPNTISPVRQSVFRKPCICIVKRAYPFTILRSLFLLYPFPVPNASVFSYKMTLPCKNPSKKPCTSAP